MAGRLGIAAVFAFVCTAAYLASGLSDPYIALSSGIAAATAITAIDLKLKNSVLKKRETLLLVSALKKLGYEIGTHVPFTAALDSTIWHLPKDSAVRDFLSSIRNRLALGAMPEEAFSSSTNGVDVSISGPIGKVVKSYGYGADTGITIAGEVQMLENRIEERKEVESGALGRYLVLSMVASTIVPSLAMFAFVGYSILESASTSIGLFDIVLLAAVPSFYAAVRAKVADIYAWQT